MTKINFVIPPLFFNKDSTGFNEMLASELSAICVRNKVDFSTYYEYTDRRANLYIFPVQYREDVFSKWFVQSIEKCKSLGGIVIVCGKSSSVEYKYILNNTEADFVALGEFDNTLQDIIKIDFNCDIQLQINKIREIPGLSYLYNSKLIKSGKRSVLSSMDDLPFPCYEYLENKNNYRLCVMESSRSCHGKCNFCEGHLFRSFTIGNEYRVKSPQRVVEEIKYVVNRYSCRVFSFSDDNFFADGDKGLQRAIEIANLLISNKTKIRFTIECRADDVKKDVFEYLKKAGLIKAFIGIESGSQSVLDRYNKGTTVEDNHYAIQTLSDLNILCHPGHILFDPKTTKQELGETVSFFEKYIDKLFSFDQGDSDRLLYYPQGCDIVYKFWPNKSQQFYENIWYNGINCEFEDEHTKTIYENFTRYMSDNEKYKNDNILKRRILCLKDAIKSVN